LSTVTDINTFRRAPFTTGTEFGKDYRLGREGLPA
jgi:hypothetical protein